MVDPGDWAPVAAKLAELNLKLEAILVTHHHSDHVGGIDRLRDASEARVFGPYFEAIPEPLTRVGAGDTVSVLGIDFEVIEVPGHTAGHIAYFHAGSKNQPTPLLFCGDTLFSGGCGRLFEGTPAQMLKSLTQLAELPAETWVCCAHEYTLSNLKFALAVDPHNPALIEYYQHCLSLRERQQATVPSFIAQERAVNPFLRSATPAVRSSIQTAYPAAQTDVDCFAALREWKNHFK